MFLSVKSFCRFHLSEKWQNRIHETEQHRVGLLILYAVTTKPIDYILRVNYFLFRAESQVKAGILLL